MTTTTHSNKAWVDKGDDVSSAGNQAGGRIKGDTRRQLKWETNECCKAAAYVVDIGQNPIHLSPRYLELSCSHAEQAVDNSLSCTCRFLAR